MEPFELRRCVVKYKRGCDFSGRWNEIELTGGNSLVVPSKCTALCPLGGGKAHKKLAVNRHKTTTSKKKKKKPKKRQSSSSRSRRAPAANQCCHVTDPHWSRCRCNDELPMVAGQCSPPGLSGSSAGCLAALRPHRLGRTRPSVRRNRRSERRRGESGHKLLHFRVPNQDKRRHTVFFFYFLFFAIT